MSRVLAGIGLGRELVMLGREAVAIIRENRAQENDALRREVDELRRGLAECQDHVGQIRRAGRIAASAAVEQAQMQGQQSLQGGGLAAHLRDLQTKKPEQD